MNSEELTPHFEELKKAIAGKVDDEKLMAELEKYINEYHVTVDVAIRSIKRKYGATESSFVTGNSLVKKVSDLTGTEGNVDIVAKVVFVTERQAKIRGLDKTILSGIIGDETGTVSFTMWEPGETELVKGSVYNFRNCYCKTWNEKVQVNIGNRGRIELAEGVTINTPERPSTDPEECKIGSIRDGLGSVTVTGKIVSVESKLISVKGEQKTVYSGIIADETGRVQFSAWNDFSLKEGEIVCIKNGYIRSWKGIPQLNLGERCEVSRVKTKMKISESGENKRTVDEINRMGGGLDLTVEGLVVDIRQGSGIIRRCPQCNRSILNGVCTSHGAVEGTPDLRLKVVVDDGTGAIGAVINRADTEKLTGVTLQAAEGLASIKGEGVVGREMAQKILMKRIRLIGNVMSDDYGPSMIVKSASSINVDVDTEAQKLLEELEASL